MRKSHGKRTSELRDLLQDQSGCCSPAVLYTPSQPLGKCSESPSLPLLTLPLFPWVAGLATLSVPVLRYPDKKQVRGVLVYIPEEI